VSERSLWKGSCTHKKLGAKPKNTRDPKAGKEKGTGKKVLEGKMSGGRDVLKAKSGPGKRGLETNVAITECS